MATVGAYPIYLYPMMGEPGDDIHSRDRRYYLGVMFMILPAGRYIIIKCPGENMMIERVWHKDDLMMALWDCFFPDGTILYNNVEGVLIEIKGEEGSEECRQFFRPILPERLEGREKRLYDYWSKNLVEIQRF